MLLGDDCEKNSSPHAVQKLKSKPAMIDSADWAQVRDRRPSVRRVWFAGIGGYPHRASQITATFETLIERDSCKAVRPTHNP
jgi:hypothetical protein